MGDIVAVDAYFPGDELLRVVRAALPPAWPIRRDGPWHMVQPPGLQLPRQGWLVEVSATPRNCAEILHHTATLCAQLGVAFQFPVDSRAVALITGRTWPRETGGRVLTLYPVDDAHFHQVIEQLHTALSGFAGPYILSDKRYKDSQVVHYRYGGIAGYCVLRSTGERQPMLMSPDGELVPDQCEPLWSPPSWLSDPFPDEALSDEEADGLHLKGSRYLIRSLLRPSVTGGAYIALDRETNAAVTIKEARPHTGIDENGLDAVDRLKREYELLQVLQDTGFTPAPLDLFWEWEHLFLVEERIVGFTLEQFVAKWNPVVHGQSTRANQEAYAEKFRKIVSNLAAGMDEMHGRGIVLGHATMADVVVTDKDAEWVRIWNLDAAREASTDHTTADDVYVLGSLLVDTLGPGSSSMARLDPSAMPRFVAQVGECIGLPATAQQTLLRCLDGDASQRPTAAQVLETLGQGGSVDLTGAEPAMAAQPALPDTLQASLNALRNSAELHRSDRLFPADPLVLATNPLSLSYGATGVGYALARLTGEVPRTIMGWILAQPVDPDRYPPGLYVGAAGVAWGLWEMGLPEVAVQTLRSAHDHPLLWEAADLFHGAAGYGLACLRFHRQTGDQEWLDRGVAVGEHLLRTRVDQGAGAYWPDRDGAVRHGYAKGASGIALYLLYLSLATGDSRFRHTAIAALEHDLHQLWDEHGTYLSMPRRSASMPGAQESCPNWYEGTAGVGTALVRFWHVTKEQRYRDLLGRIAPDACRPYTASPGLFHGLAGLGNFLLDLYDFTGDATYREQAQEAGRTTTLFGIKSGTGVAFPGEQATHLSMDLGTGTAGVALFLHRLAHSHERPGNFNFVLDQLLG